MITFFLHDATVYALATEQALPAAATTALSWLLRPATLVSAAAIDGIFVGPRREMISPWSTNAVEITQNMGIDGITRIEQYTRVDSAAAPYDTMLQTIYHGLDQQLFALARLPQPITYIDDIDAYDAAEGLALSADEKEYLRRVVCDNQRPLTDSELFAFAQINSEHCRHKIFGGTFIINGVAQQQTLFDMIKSTTRAHRGRILSAYKDNVAFAEGPTVTLFAPRRHTHADTYATRAIPTVIALKAETHNFPTTVEPFNGASTGTGGEIRDRMAGGVGSYPLAGTAVYMTSYTRLNATLPCHNALAPRQWLYQTPTDILIKASNGASDFGNKFGQPLICGSLLTFEHRERATTYAYDKVIMLAGGVGFAQRRDYNKGTPQQGQAIVVMGGDNYRIGLGGGSVSSVETGRYATDIELNAVQRANPEMQKRVYNVIRALTEEESNPIISVHDHGSAGHVNCLSELVEGCGAQIDMSQLPIGDKTLSAKEIIANESQERMGLLIAADAVPYVQQIADRERAPLYVVGRAVDNGAVTFTQADGQQPFNLTMDQMFGATPKTIMRDETVERHFADGIYSAEDIETYLSHVLSLESVACKDWLTNKVDRSVTGRVARQQCQGRLQLPLSDCGVVALDHCGEKGIATAIGHAPQAALIDAPAGSILSVAEALTNIVLAPLTYGLEGVSLSANWMWPCRNKGEDARLYAAVQALSTFCQALKVNVPTGKDSLSMTQQYPDGTTVLAPGTVIVSAASEVSAVRHTVAPVLQPADSVLWLIDFSAAPRQLGGSALAQSQAVVGATAPTVADAQYFSRAFAAVQALVHAQLLLAGHDVSAGGLVTCLLEMCFANVSGGLSIDLRASADDLVTTLFAENPALVVQVAQENVAAAQRLLAEHGVAYIELGTPHSARTLTISHPQRTLTLDIDALRATWFAPSARLDERQCCHDKAREREANIFHQPIEYTFPAHFTGRLADYRGAGTAAPRRVRAAVIREKGSNSERELAYAFYHAGCEVKDITMTDLISGRETLDDVNIIAFCGGFSNSDVLGSAKGWAGAFLFNARAKDALDRFYQRGDTLSIGICNGCQLMVELGLLTHSHAVADATAYAQMAHNDSHKFESAFVSLTIPQNNSVMFGTLGGSTLGVWVAHGEGKFVLPQDEGSYNIVAKYTYPAYPANPNGSSYAVAALASADGRHIAIMPHPERTLFPWQCAYYPSARCGDEYTPWLEAFVNARRWVEDRL